MRSQVLDQLKIAFGMFSANDHKGAYSLLSRTLAHVPRNARLLPFYMMASTSAANIHLTKQAIAFAKIAIRLNPNSARAIATAADACVEAGRHREAIRYYRKSIAIEARVTTLCRFAGLLIHHGYLRRAEAICRQAIAREPDWDEASFLLGQSMILKDPQQAAAYCEQSWNVDKSHFPYQRNSAIALALAGNYHQAHERMQSCRLARPMDALVLLFGAAIELLVNRGRFSSEQMLRSVLVDIDSIAKRVASINISSQFRNILRGEFTLFYRYCLAMLFLQGGYRLESMLCLRLCTSGQPGSEIVQDARARVKTARIVRDKRVGL